MGALGIAAVSPQRAMASEDYERKARPEGERPREKTNAKWLPQKARS